MQMYILEHRVSLYLTYITFTIFQLFRHFSSQSIANLSFVGLTGKAELGNLDKIQNASYLSTT